MNEVFVMNSMCISPMRYESYSSKWDVKSIKVSPIFLASSENFKDFLSQIIMINEYFVLNLPIQKKFGERWSYFQTYLILI